MPKSNKLFFEQLNLNAQEKFVDDMQIGLRQQKMRVKNPVDVGILDRNDGVVGLSADLAKAS